MAGEIKARIHEAPIPQAKVFSCTSCGSSLQLRAEGQTQIVVCSSCKSIIDVRNTSYEVITKFKSKRTRSMSIPLGTRGKLHGTLWEVIGYMERNDGGSYSWSEYLLFNPMKGFRWLSENNGHWSFVLMTKERPQANTGFGYGSATYSGLIYDLFHKGIAKIHYIEGEFYWQARIDDQVEVMDFIRENELLSMEKNKSEIVWSVSEYVQSDDIAAAFKTKKLPPPMGIAPNQPCPISEKMKGIGKWWGLFLLLLFMIQFLSFITSSNKIVHQEKFTFHPVHFPGAKTSLPFDLDDQTANVHIRVYAPLNNSWLFIQGELVNVDSGESEEFDVGLEYYSGYDDGAWTEGSRYGSKNIPAISGGKYQINFEPSGDIFPMDYEISVVRDVPVWSSFLWAIFFISFWPLFLLFRKRSFKVSKWADSDYNPYQSMEDDE